MYSPDLSLAVIELEELRKLERRQAEEQLKRQRHTPVRHRRFPPACLRLLRGIEGNLRCADCAATNVDWASISYGSLYCIDCSGSHRQLGVQISVVRSISMDSWSHSEVLSMLEGGNKQLNDFFNRHGLPTSHYRIEDDTATRNRYKTNAAMFYRENLSLHVGRIEESGAYKGRKFFRKTKRRGGSKKPSSCAVQRTLEESDETEETVLECSDTSNSSGSDSMF